MAYLSKNQKRKRNGVRRKERNGEGSFREYYLADGTLRLQYTFPYKLADGKTRYKSVSGRSDVECYNLKEDFLKPLKLKLPQGKYNATICDLLSVKYENSLKSGRCNKTGYKRNLDTLKIISNLPEYNPIGLIPIRMVSEEALCEFLFMLPELYSQSVIKKIHTALKAAFKLAKDKEIIKDNLMNIETFQKPPVSLKKTKMVKAWDLSDLKIFENEIKQYKFHGNENNYMLQYFIELSTGMRMGEINALNPEDVCLEKNYIHDRKTFSRYYNDKVFIKTTPKTNSSNRKVPISNQARPYLELALSQYKKNKYNLLFYNHKDNCIIRTQSCNDWLKKFCKNNRLPFYGQHMLRHTFATNCARAKMPVYTLSSILGHSDIKITNKYYINLNDEDKINALNEAVDYLNGIN